MGGQVLEEGGVGGGGGGWGPRGAVAVGPVEEGEGGVWVGDVGEDGGDLFFISVEFVVEGLLPVGGSEDLGDSVGELEEFRGRLWEGFRRVLDARDEVLGFGHGIAEQGVRIVSGSIC